MPSAKRFDRWRLIGGDASPSVLDQPVHLVEQCGDLLDLVDDHLPGRVRARRLELLAQQSGRAV